MTKIPQGVRSVLQKWSAQFSETVWPRFQMLMFAATRRQHLQVSWHGGGRRQVAVVTGTSHWYKGREGLVSVRWVFVEDLTGTHRDEYFFTSGNRHRGQVEARRSYRRNALLQSGSIDATRRGHSRPQD